MELILFSLFFFFFYGYYIYRTLRIVNLQKRERERKIETNGYVNSLVFILPWNRTRATMTQQQYCVYLGVVIFFRGCRARSL